MRIACVILGALAALTAACSGGGELTLEDYFARVDELDQRRSDELGRLDEELGELAPNDVEGGLRVLDQQTDAREEFAEGLDDLDAPDDVSGLHEGAVSAHHRAVEVFREFVENNRDATTVIELLQGFAGVDFEAISAAVEQCEELERAALRENIEIALDCE